MKRHFGRFTELEWVNEMNREYPQLMLMCAELLLYAGGKNDQNIALGSGVTSSVAGEVWIQSYYDGFSRHATNTSEKSFRLGDSRVFRSIGQTVVTVYSWGTDRRQNQVLLRCQVEVDIIAARIPLLVSRKALCAASGIIDFPDNSLRLKTQYRIQLQLNLQGHMAIPFVKSPPGSVRVVEITL